MTEPEITDYTTIVVGTDGSSLAAPTVRRAALAATREGGDLVIVCAYSDMSRRADAKNVATVGGDTRDGQVLGKTAASEAVAAAVAVARQQRATITAALLVDGEPAKALISVAEERNGNLLVIGARQQRSFTERMLGTVAEEVTKRATCDVLIVRPMEETGDLSVPESDG
jgi:nucleotide-binding universal stress UspA family protein